MPVTAWTGVSQSQSAFSLILSVLCALCGKGNELRWYRGTPVVLILDEACLFFPEPVTPGLDTSTTGRHDVKAGISMKTAAIGATDETMSLYATKILKHCLPSSTQTAGRVDAYHVLENVLAQPV
jgi:hypothetical protein